MACDVLNRVMIRTKVRPQSTSNVGEMAIRGPAGIRAISALARYRAFFCRIVLVALLSFVLLGTLVPLLKKFEGPAPSWHR